MTIDYDPNAITVLGADPGDNPFDSQPDIVINGTLGLATITGDTTGVGAGDGSYTFASVRAQAVGSPGFTPVEVTNVEFRDKTGAVFSGVSASAQGVSITEAESVPGVTTWGMVALAGFLAAVMLWKVRRRHRAMIE